MFNFKLNAIQMHTRVCSKTQAKQKIEIVKTERDLNKLTSRRSKQ